jgi:hypothetical protein
LQPLRRHCPPGHGHARDAAHRLVVLAAGGPGGHGGLLGHAALKLAGASYYASPPRSAQALFRARQMDRRPAIGQPRPPPFPPRSGLLTAEVLPAVIRHRRRSALTPDLPSAVEHPDAQSRPPAVSAARGARSGRVLEHRPGVMPPSPAPVAPAPRVQE